MSRLVLFLLSCFLAATTGAQVCGTDEIHRLRMATDTAYASRFEADQEAFRQFSSAQNRIMIQGRDTTYELPVVFHVMHTGQAVGTPLNPSDAQLIALLDYVNKTFNAEWAGYPDTNSGGVRTNIRFVLPQNDMRCKATTGIMRANASSVPGYSAYGLQYGGSGNGADESALVAKSPSWSGTSYINIYIVQSLGSSIAGYAYYPTTPGNRVFVAATWAMAGQEVLVHELAHTLNIMHTFAGPQGSGSCPPATNCAFTGDEICDTEPAQSWPDCASPINPCTGVAWAGVQHNIMNYSNCKRDRFTRGQSLRMREAIKYHYYTMAASSAGQPAVSPALRAASCVPVKMLNPGIKLNYGPLRVQLNTLDCPSGGYAREDTMLYVDKSCVYRTSLRAGQTYKLWVRTDADNNVVAYIDYNNDGVFQTPAERIDVDLGEPARTRNDHGVNITVPLTGVVRNTPLRMRIIADWYQAANFLPCGDRSLGQAEDYALTILPPNVGISGSQKLVLSVYPNPVAGQLQVRLPAALSGSVRIYNALGQLQLQQAVHNQSALQLELGTMAAGLYRILVEDQHGVQGSERFVKQ